MNIFNKLGEPCNDLKHKGEHQRNYIERKRKIERFYNIRTNYTEKEKEKEEYPPSPTSSLTELL